MTIQHNEYRTEDGDWRQQKHQDAYVVAANEGRIVSTGEHSFTHRTLSQRNTARKSKDNQAQY
ncbi:MAG TPA: hypothetical protein VIG25_01050 [Pyrinomonadaceae bacterium]|jgi:hypothetical protein